MTFVADDAPYVSVVMATFGRGRHILPSVRSVLQQELQEFELIVAGDACTDETGAVVAGLGHPRVRWLNLAERCGSQSAPNNAGIAAARGEVIAYLGHDDIWAPDHLTRIVQLFRSEDPPDVAVSGSVFHLPNGLPGSEVMGLFADGADVSGYFFPPSSFAHRKAALDRIGGWRMAMEIRAPVDADLLQRAKAAGLVFRSTGAVTVHKFAAGQRYLSYVEQESHEQEAMLAALGGPGHAARVSAILEEARQSGSYMPTSQGSFERFAPGELARRNMVRKGAQKVDLRPLGAGVTIRHRKEPAAYDWKQRPVLGFRVTKANPRPRLLVPVTGTRADLRFLLAHPRREALVALDMLVNGVPVTARPERLLRLPGLHLARCRLAVDLRPDRPTLLELRLTGIQRPARGGVGLAIGPLRLRPSEGHPDDRSPAKG